LSASGLGKGRFIEAIGPRCCAACYRVRYVNSAELLLEPARSLRMEPCPEQMHVYAGFELLTNAPQNGRIGQRTAMLDNQAMERVRDLLEHRPRLTAARSLVPPTPVSRFQGIPRFLAHLTKCLFHCCRAVAHGDPLDLWFQLHYMSIPDAALDLGRRIAHSTARRHLEAG
jgi:hypothetical protein